MRTFCICARVTAAWRRDDAFLAITSWAQIGFMQTRYSPDQLVPYYTVSLMIFVCMTGTVAGIFLMI